jgi:hypothetical protein
MGMELVYVYVENKIGNRHSRVIEILKLVKLPGAFLLQLFIFPHKFLAQSVIIYNLLPAVLQAVNQRLQKFWHGLCFFTSRIIKNYP